MAGLAQGSCPVVMSTSRSIMWDWERLVGCPAVSRMGAPIPPAASLTVTRKGVVGWKSISTSLFRGKIPSVTRKVVKPPNFV